MQQGGLESSRVPLLCVVEETPQSAVRGTYEKEATMSLIEIHNELKVLFPQDTPEVRRHFAVALNTEAKGDSAKAEECLAKAFHTEANANSA